MTQDGVNAARKALKKVERRLLVSAARSVGSAHPPIAVRPPTKWTEALQFAIWVVQTEIKRLPLPKKGAKKGKR